MSKIEEVRSAMVAAMKAKDKETKETLSALLAALKNKAIDKRADLTEEEEVQVIMKATLTELSIDTPTAKDKGRIMKVLMPKVKGKADGKLVNETLMSYLN